MKRERVVILGASDKPDRYANQAFHLLRQHGHEVVPVHPALEMIEDVPVVKSLREVEGNIDTVTIYLRPEVSEPLTEDLIRLRPNRVILNPGTESPNLSGELGRAGISVVPACTLVLLHTGQY